MLTMVAVIRAVVVNKAAHLWHGNAQRGGGIITERKGVQRTGIIKTDGQPRQYHYQRQLEFRPAYAAKAAQQPEHHVARLLRAGRGADGIGGNGVKQLRGRYARQDRAFIAAARAVGQEGDEGKGGEGSGKRARRKRYCAGAETQYDD